MKVADLARLMVTGMFNVAVCFKLGRGIFNDEVTVEQFAHDYCNDEIAFITIEHGKLIVGLK